MSGTKVSMWKLDDDIPSCDMHYEVPLLQNDLGMSDDLPVSEHCQPLLTAVAAFSRLTLLRPHVGHSTPQYMMVLQ